MRGKQKLARALGIQKEIGGNHAYFRDDKVSIWEKNAIHCFVMKRLLELLLLNYL